MANFVYDGPDFASNKTNLNPIPSGASTLQYVDATNDWNAAMRALNDLRGGLRNAKLFGFTRQASAPGGVPDYLWLRSDGNLFLHTPSGDTQIAFTTSTLQGVYSAGGAGPQTILFDSTRLGLRLRDASTPISGSLFEIQNQAGSTTYHAFTPTAYTLSGILTLNSGASKTGAIQSTDAQNATVSASGEGKIRWNGSTNKWEASENGIAYASFVSTTLQGGYTNGGANGGRINITSSGGPLYAYSSAGESELFAVGGTTLPVTDGQYLRVGFAFGAVGPYNRAPDATAITTTQSSHRTWRTFATFWNGSQSKAIDCYLRHAVINISNPAAPMSRLFLAMADAGGDITGSALAVQKFHWFNTGEVAHTESAPTDYPVAQWFKSQATARSTGAIKGCVWEAGAHTNQTASAEIIDFDFNSTRTLTWQTGAIALQRSFVIRPPALAFAAASTVTTAVLCEILGPPTAGANATITNPIAFRVASGVTVLAGNVAIGGGFLKPLVPLAIGKNGTAGYDIDIVNPINISGVNGGGQHSYVECDGFATIASNNTGGSGTTLHVGGFVAAQWQQVSMFAAAAEVFRINSGIARTISADLRVKKHSAFTDSDTITTTGAVQTTNATQTTAFTLALADTTLYWVTAEVVGRDTSGTDRAGYTVSALVYRQGGGATIQTGVVNVSAVESGGAAAWDATFTVSSNDLRVSVTGAASTTINWACTVKVQPVSGNS